MLDWIAISAHRASYGQVSPRAELGSTEGITGDFLLDADFLKIPRGRDEAPLVLLD